MVQEKPRLGHDVWGLALIGLGVSAVLAGIFLLPLWAFPIPLAGFILLNFGGHAAIHRELIAKDRSWAPVGHEIVLSLCYMFHLSNYHHIVPAHLEHHTMGRTHRYGMPDVVNDEAGWLQLARYYVFLLFVPFCYWAAKGWAGVLLHPFRREHLSPGSAFPSIRFRLPYWVPQAGIGVFIAASLAYAPLAFVIYCAGACISWNMLQNVAHYGLTGPDERLKALASRTYVVDPVTRRLTFGSLAHLPHHIDMSVPGRILHAPTTLFQMQHKLGQPFHITYGVRNYALDVLRQLRGPVKRSELIDVW